MVEYNPTTGNYFESSEEVIKKAQETINAYKSISSMADWESEEEYREIQEMVEASIIMRCDDIHTRKVAKIITDVAALIGINLKYFEAVNVAKSWKLL